MNSLRGRLTLSYAILVATVLGIAVFALSAVVFVSATAPIRAAQRDAARIARETVVAHPGEPARRIELLILERGARPGIVILGPPHGQLGMPHPRPEGPPDPQRFGISALMGLHPERIRVGADVLLIVPDVGALADVFTTYLRALGACTVVIIFLAWLIARWITGIAIRPLTTVTAELRRFGSGDFTPRAVMTTDADELGALITAYNAAAAQVTAAFAERLSAETHMRRFVADAGHELRTPLTVINAYLDILARADSADTALRERALQTIDVQTQRMRTLVERLMLLARLESPESTNVSTVDVAAVAADAISEITAARGGDVRLDADPGTCVLADPNDLHEAIGNLVDNAVKYGEHSNVDVRVSAGDGTVVVRVCDGGPGIPRHEREHVFERFYRGERRSEVPGSGLGLSIVERSVARYGGRVVLENGDPGRTTFALVLPAYEEAGDRNGTIRV